MLGHRSYSLTVFLSLTPGVSPAYSMGMRLKGSVIAYWMLWESHVQVRCASIQLSPRPWEPFSITLDAATFESRHNDGQDISLYHYISYATRKHPAGLYTATIV